MIVVTHQIAGIVFRTESDAWLPCLHEEPFERFRVGDVGPDVRNRIHRVGEDSLTLPPPVGEEQERIFHYTRGWPGRLASPLLRSPAVRATLQTCLERPEHVKAKFHKNWVIIHDFARRQLDLFYTPEPAKYPAEFYVGGYLPRMFSAFLPCFSATLIHAASVLRNDKAAVFLAAGGRGKTTVVELSAGVPVLSDDQIIFRKEDHTVSAHATPLAANTSGRCEAPVGGLFMLEKAPHFELVLLKPADLVQCLWTACSSNTGPLTRDLKKRLYGVICDTCYQAPAYQMRFPKDYVDWDAIDAAMVR